MKRSQRLTLLALSVALVLAGVALVLTSTNAAQPPRDEQWKKVQEAQDKGLPKTAIEHLNPIIESALKDKAYPEAIKAIARKITLEGVIEGNKPEEKITRMQAAIATAPAEMHPVMNAILAHWYWHYFQQNRWRFVQRTATGQSPGNDIQTWDLPRIFAEIDKTFDKALANEKELKATPVEQYDAVLVKGSIPDKYRPTLFDFLAFDALSFYNSAEQAGAKPQDDYELPADSPVFGSIEEFLKWEPKTSDPGNRTVKAIKLYQNLLRFHQNDADKSALFDTDLHRLRFGWNKAVGENRNDNYKAALEAFAKAHDNHELYAMARYQLATVIRGENDLVKAREVALSGVRAFPDSPGGKLCYNLVQDIEARSATATTERVWADPLPTIKVNYRNVTKAYFRVYAADYIERLKATRWRPEQLTPDESKALLTQKSVLEFNHDLPPTPDYQARTEIIPAPAGLKPGFYYLVVSHAPDFGETNNTVSYTDFWVSNLAVVERHSYGTARAGGLVTDNRTGEPLEGAKVQLWTRGNNGGWSAGETTTTDKSGLFGMPVAAQKAHAVVVTHKEQQLASASDLYSWQNGPQPLTGEQVVFFTDRSLYRPGQTVHFKGIYVRWDHEKDNYEALANRDAEVIFSDVNGKEIARHKAKTNDYGSFSGSFTAPRDRLMGRMSIHTPTGNGYAPVTVEEYKRPKFKVEVDAPKEVARLNAEVKVRGKAVQYNGVPVGGAKVTFRVTREVQYPVWFFECCCWWRPIPSRPAQEIAHGTVLTEPDGSFTVPFVAKPDLTIPEKDEPSFRYTITADVTDTTGETRSASRTVNVGYVALRATVGSDAWVTSEKETTFSIETTTLGGEGQPAKGALAIHTLKQPDKAVRADLAGDYVPRFRAGAGENEEPLPDASKPQSWELGDSVFRTDFATNGNGKADAKAELAPGIYRAILTTQDKFGKKVTARYQFTVVNPAADKFPVKVPNYVAAPKWSVEVGETFTLLWGTGYDTGRAYVEVEHRGKVVQSFWTEKNATQQVLKVPVKEEMRGGFTVRVTQVRENRAYLANHHIDVPWTNKTLTVKWERFVNKLEPGAKETFTAVISGPDAKKAVAEFVAAMYDASLDAYLPHHWTERFGVFRQDYSTLQMSFDNVPKWFQHVQGQWPNLHKAVDLTYRGFPQEITQNWQRYDYFGQGGGYGFGDQMFFERETAARGFGGPGGGPPGLALPAAAPAAGEPKADAGFLGGAGGGVTTDAFTGGLQQNGQPGASPGPDLSKVSARKNLQETAFFFPHLVSDSGGVVRVQFTMPEALTKWKFMGFAHDKQLRSGYLSGEVVTAKDLMAQPNPPRFLREGDSVEFTVKVSNQSATRQAGTARLSFKDLRTDKPVDAELGLADADRPFELAAGESKTLSWKISVPDGMGPVSYKAVAATDRLSDGEEAAIPVLSRRVLVQESLPLPIRGPGTKDFDFAKLRKSADSQTIKSQSLTVQMVSQPAWYAVMALPYLMEYPYECSEQTFNRLYANALARHIATSDPKIRKVFDQWKNTPALDSPLEKNQDLKSVVLEETPWVRQAQAESQARRNVGILFDDNRLNEETARLTAKLAQMQHADGSWPWFPGGPGNDYITLYITTGYGRLRHLGVKVDAAPAVKALARLDAWSDKEYRWALQHNPEKNHLSATLALYLYGRSFFLADRAVANEHRAATDYWLGQAKKYWLQLANRQSQAHLALALKRFGDKETPDGIVKSIRERSKTDKELGMYWRDTELSYSWVRAPIETQAVMVEAFDEVANDAKAVEECKVWLLKQKQTQDWQTTKATADAVYALLLRGDNLLASDALVEVQLGAQVIKPEKVEAGTGFYEQKFLRDEVKPSMSAIKVSKPDKGVSWGSVHWSYLEDIDKVTPHEGTPLKVEKKLYRKTLTKSGPVIQPVKDGEALSVGDEVVVRVVLRTDRDMEYVHLRDHRGSGTEPVNVLSRYRFQDGLYYYESTKDAATHFFIDYLPKGVYVFEYPLRVQLRGKYATGYANVECMYAPEFNSHSENISLEVK